MQTARCINSCGALPGAGPRPVPPAAATLTTVSLPYLAGDKEARVRDNFLGFFLCGKMGGLFFFLPSLRPLTSGSGAGVCGSKPRQSRGKAMAEEEPPASTTETPAAAVAEEATGSVGAGAPGAEDGAAGAEATIHEEEEGEGGAEEGAETADGSPPDGPADTFPSADDGVPKTSEKISRMQSLDPADLPPSYSSNSPEELLVLEYVENFRRQFVQLYPDRKDLLLVPRNECGVEKFLCSTVRPTQLEYSDLYDLEDCASFVAEHIQYEALMDPVALPMYVPSPSSVLTWQMGDCFDMSIVLASLLLGSGFDAHV